MTKDKREGPKVLEFARCEKTGNPCGTDTIVVGQECQCATCLTQAEVDTFFAMIKVLA